MGMYKAMHAQADIRHGIEAQRHDARVIVELLGSVTAEASFSSN